MGLIGLIFCWGHKRKKGSAWRNLLGTSCFSQEVLGIPQVECRSQHHHFIETIRYGWCNMPHATSCNYKLPTITLGVIDVTVLICFNWCIIPANKFGKPHSPFRFFSPAIPFECFGRCTSKTHGILFLSSLVYHWDNMVIMDHGNAIGGGKGVVVSCWNCCRR